MKDSRLPWAVLRLSAVMPTSGSYRLSMARLMFDMALAARCEIVVDLDAAYALVQAAESLCDGGAIRGKTAFIAGGTDKGCQMDIATMISHNLTPGSTPRRLFRHRQLLPRLVRHGRRSADTRLPAARGAKTGSGWRFGASASCARCSGRCAGLAGLYLECVGRRERAMTRRRSL